MQQPVGIRQVWERERELRAAELQLEDAFAQARAARYRPGSPSLRQLADAERRYWRACEDKRHVLEPPRQGAPGG